MNAKLEFLGAYETVTGSKTLVSFRNRRYLVDCGLFQGPSEIRQKNWSDLEVPAESIDAVFLTHAHLDHCGYLPRLYRSGFRGPVYCTKGTALLASVILKDAAFLEEEQAEYAKKTGYSYHEDPQPLFTIDDAEKVIAQFRTEKRQEWREVASGLSIRFLRAGHIVGASMVQLRFADDVKPLIVTFSGDVGNNRSLILKGPEPIPSTDVLILESTYGNRLHSDESGLTQLGRHLAPVLKKRGVAIIPAFAVGRSQELIYMISRLEQSGVIPKVPVILDSPMAKEALEIFMSQAGEHSMISGFRANSDFLPEKFRATANVDESMVACMMDGPAIVISASGMLSGGRVLHHLKQRLPDPKNIVIFTGYQAEGSKGRFLQDQGQAEGRMRIHHKEVDVAAQVVSIDSLSCHADYNEMIALLQSSDLKPFQVILNHGEKEAQNHLAEILRERFAWNVATSRSQQSWLFE